MLHYCIKYLTSFLPMNTQEGCSFHCLENSSYRLPHECSVDKHKLKITRTFNNIFIHITSIRYTKKTNNELYISGSTYQS
jgi:hypothetical protein